MKVAFKKPATSPHSLDLIAEALLLPTGIDGVYARTAAFEQVVNGLSNLISRYREPETEILRFPPVMSRRQVERSGYLKSFPHVLGCVSCLAGNEAEIGAAVERHEAGDDWTSQLSAADLVLSPAACYPIYPLVASRRFRLLVSCSTLPATAFGGNRRKCSIVCSRSACANMFRSAPRPRSRNFGGVG